jgi:Dual specificity phosphatase, catalytic domain
MSVKALTAWAFFNRVRECEFALVDVRQNTAGEMACPPLREAIFAADLRSEDVMMVAAPERQDRVLVYDGGGDTLLASAGDADTFVRDLEAADAAQAIQAFAALSFVQAQVEAGRHVEVLAESFEKVFMQRYGFLAAESTGAGASTDLPPFFPAQVDALVFLGGQISATDRRVFDGLGIRRVLNCTDDLPCSFQKSDRNVSYLRLPLRDEERADLGSVLREGVEFIEGGCIGSEPVLVHCERGQSRSASLVIAWLIEKRGMSFPDALGLVQRCRPVARPNPGFMQQLEWLDLEKE